MLQLIAIVIASHLFLAPNFASAFNFGFSPKIIRREVVVHIIKNPRISVSHLVEIGDDIDLNFLKMYGNCFENGSMLYLATWENYTRVIGMVEVLPDTGDEWRKELPEPFGGKNFTFRGLDFDDVVTHRQHRRKGVATALFRAIERDAYELVERMEKCGGMYCGPSDGRIRLQLVPAKAALGFYRSIGFQIKPWKDDSVKKQQSYLQRLRDRLKWTWRRLNPKSHHWSHSLHLIEIVGNVTCSMK